MIREKAWSLPKDIKKIYLYLVCLISLFVMLWGLIDLLSASTHLLTMEPLAVKGAMGNTDMESTIYFQRQMIFDRIGDGAARALICAVIFAYFSLKLKNYEEEEK